jgi:acyl-CoA ligase (AMP-forming) (exosortase A-associated)
VQIPNPNPSPLDHLAICGKANSTAMVTKAESIDYAMLDQMVGRLAAAIRAAGLVAGDRVASWLNKTAEACILPLAAARAGVVHVPINPALKRAQVAHILGDSGAKLLIAGEGRLAALSHGDVPDTCAIWSETVATEARLTGAGLPPSTVDPDSLCAILYTSGSTGKPKGVMLSHANLWLGAISVAHYLGLAADDKTLCVLPLSFDYGQNQLLSTWAAGGCAVPLDYLSAREVVRAVAKHEITTLAGVPPLWVQLVEVEWPGDGTASLRRLTNSGGALTPPLVRKLRSQFSGAQLFPMYGLTEAFRSTYLPPHMVDTHPTSIGGAIPFAEILVITADGRTAAAGEPGELVHAGPLVAHGYWQDAERTALRFKPAPACSEYGGMAVWSGDNVMRDGDGLLYFVGRDDEMIKTSGNRVSPAEVEEVAVNSGLAHEAVSFGVADARVGQTIVLIVRGDAGGDEALRSYFRAELPAFMQPGHIIWRTELPRNPNGKLDRTAIRAEAEAALANRQIDVEKAA